MIRPLLSVLLFAPPLLADDIVLADFESPNFGNWKVEGTAFGKGPAAGKVGGQQDVTGFLGKGLANSFHPNDDSLGSLTSPSFLINRKWLTFYIGGGGFEGETCLNLVIDGNVVLTATGSNIQSGGNEQLRPYAWDLSEFQGKQATLEIVDKRRGGWGHINVDQLVLTDDRRQIPLARKSAIELTREITVDGTFLQLPLMNRRQAQEEGVHKFTIELDGKTVRFMHLKFPSPDEKPDYWYSADLREFAGKTVSFRVRSHDPEVLNNLTISDQEIIDPKAYRGPHRPRFHFSPRMGWMNDVNGSYYQDGLYHIFYQANPTTAAQSTGFDMHWGHSVSKDLVHWEEWPIALFPDETGNCYSGTAVMTRKPIPGVTDGAILPSPVLFFTGTSPFAQHFATTRDGGRSWQRFPGNPVLPVIRSSDRDPKVIWHEESRHYVMVLYVGEPHHYHLFRSKDLQHWEQTQILPGWYECPEFFRVKSPTTGEDLWLLYGCYRTPEGHPKAFDGNSVYQLGNFDGKTFTPVSEIRHAHRGPNFYAALTFVNEPNDRQIMMGWTRGIQSPGEPFNQAATIPLHLQLKKINNEDILCFEPAPEVANLREAPIVTLKNTTGAEARTHLANLSKEDVYDIVIRYKKDPISPITVTTRTLKFTFDPASGNLNNDRPIHPEGPLDARILMDRSLIESFWNGGEAAFTHGSLHTDDGPVLDFNDDAQISELTVYPMKNIWKAGSPNSPR